MGIIIHLVPGLHDAPSCFVPNLTRIFNRELTQMKIKTGFKPEVMTRDNLTERPFVLRNYDEYYGKNLFVLNLIKLDKIKCNAMLRLIGIFFSFRFIFTSRLLLFYSCSLYC